MSPLYRHPCPSGTWSSTWVACCSSGIRRRSSPGLYPDPAAQAQIRQQIFEHADWHEFDRGTHRLDRAAVELFARAPGLTPDETRDAACTPPAIRCSPIAGTIQLVEDLAAAGVHLYLLSNMPVSTFEYLVEPPRLLPPLQAPGDLRRHPADQARARHLQTPRGEDRHRARRKRVHRRPARERDRRARVRPARHPVPRPGELPRGAAHLSTPPQSETQEPTCKLDADGRFSAAAGVGTGRQDSAPVRAADEARAARGRRPAEPHDLAQPARASEYYDAGVLTVRSQGQDRLLAQDVLRLHHRQRPFPVPARRRATSPSRRASTATTPRSTTRPASWCGSTRSTG